MSHWLMYFIMMLDNVKCVSVIITGVVVALYPFIWLFGYMISEMDDKCEQFCGFMKRAIKPAVIALVFSLCIMAFAPSTRQAATIYCVPKIINAVDESEIPENLQELASEWIKQKTEEIKEKP